MESTFKFSMEKTAYEQLRNLILSRKIAPGTQLVENVISEKLNISRTPVRNALKMLTREGLVNIIPNKGAFVIQPTYEEVRQAFEIRRELEVTAIELASYNIDEFDIKKLVQLNKQEIQAFEKQDIIRYLEINKQFHRIIITFSKNKFLIDYATRIINQINIYLILFDAFYNIKFDELRSINEHENLINLFTKKDFLALKTAIRDHINTSFKNLEMNNNFYKTLDELLTL